MGADCCRHSWNRRSTDYLFSSVRVVDILAWLKIISRNSNKRREREARSERALCLWLRLEIQELLRTDSQDGRKSKCDDRFCSTHCQSNSPTNGDTVLATTCNTQACE